MKEAINERIEVKLQLFRYVESAVPNFDRATEEFKARHHIIVEDLKKDVQELKKAKEKLCREN